MLQIKTTGIEDYLDGSSNVKMLVLGDPGVGKTRSSSYWPKPIYGDVEAGRASIRDRKMPYAEIHNSTEMLEFIVFLEREAKRHPDKADRAYQTVVIDTIDGYARKVQQEWLQLTGKPTFSGFEAWGYLDQKMQQLLVRLLNLDYNVIVNVHFKEKDNDEGTNRIVLQLKGDVATSIFNDFDLVGYMGSYWKAEDGERVEKRGLTFHKTPDRTILKDRFGVMPRWIPITFAETDYTQLRDALGTGLEGVEESQVIGEIPSLEDEATIPTRGVVSPDEAGGGALPPQEARELPLDKLDKPTLVKMARDLGVSVKGNALKSEIVKAIQDKQAEAASPAAEGEPTVEAPEATASESDAPTASVSPDTTATNDAPATDVADASVETVTTTDGQTAEVDTTTGEIRETGTDVTETDVADVAAALGATVVEETTTEPTPEPEAAPAAPAPEAGPVCGVCGTSLAGENQDYVRLSFIKFRSRLCNDGYIKAKSQQLTALPAGFTCR